MSDLNEERETTIDAFNKLGDKTKILIKRFLAQLLVDMCEEPLEALGIVMRETEISVYCEDGYLSLDRECKELYETKLDQPYTQIAGQDILNTLKEGESDV